MSGSFPPDLPVVVLSNRGPVSFRRERGERTVRRGAGGLVTALAGLAGHLQDAVWVCAASTAEDAAVAREHGGQPVTMAMGATPSLTGTAGEPTLDVRFVEIDHDAQEDFYSVISNPLLWFVQHGLYGLATAPEITQREHDAFDHGYVVVNDAFADAVCEEVERRGGRAVVLLQDYHFYLVAEQVRQRCPGGVLSHFVHIPWPGADGWRVLPPRMRERILRGLLGNDVVAFHTEEFARSFVLCCHELLGLPVDHARLTVDVDGRTVRARHYPISIEVGALEELAAGEEVAAHQRTIERTLLSDDRQLILRVDRTDPSKNIVRGFRAFEQLLLDHPELVGRVTFLAMLQPSRLDVPEYADYVARIGAAVARINARYAREGQAPIDLRLQEDFPYAVAAYSLCDVLVVNAVADGMNLVVKETAVVNRRDGVLALSERTGAHAELGAFAVTLYPFDVQQQADALHEALTMDRAERRERLRAAAAVVRANDVGKWLSNQLDDLLRWSAPGAPGAAR
ncbi:MAG: trehalose-6-phosphate synthase [Frankiaceae bacterium]